MLSYLCLENLRKFKKTIGCSKPKGKTSLHISKHRWKDNIKGCETGNLIHVTQSRDEIGNVALCPTKYGKFIF